MNYIGVSLNILWANTREKYTYQISKVRHIKQKPKPKISSRTTKLTSEVPYKPTLSASITC